jgi:type IV secretory pathway VirB6-like protein
VPEPGGRADPSHGAGFFFERTKEMNELLNNEAVQAALIAFIVVGLKALVEFIKSKTAGSLVAANWCYLQPVVASFINGVKDIIINKTGAAEVADYGTLVNKSLTDFQQQYKLFEGKQPTKAEMNAAKTELLAALKRLIEG